MSLREGDKVRVPYDYAPDDYADIVHEAEDGDEYVVGTLLYINKRYGLVRIVDECRGGGISPLLP